MEYIILIIVIMLVVFLLTREFWCWYWKINARINQINIINDNLEQIKALLLHMNQTNNRNLTNDINDKLPKL